MGQLGHLRIKITKDYEVMHEHKVNKKVAVSLEVEKYVREEWLKGKELMLKVSIDVLYTI